MPQGYQADVEMWLPNSDLESSVEKETMRFDTKLSVRDILDYDGMCICSECLGHEALLVGVSTIWPKAVSRPLVIKSLTAV